MHVIRFFSVVLVSLVAADLWAARQDERGGEKEMVSLVMTVLRGCKNGQTEETSAALKRAEAEMRYPAQGMAERGAK